MSEKPFTLEDAISLAAKAHKGQVDKAGAPYILHPLRVMQNLAGMKAMMAGVLHDVVEDSEYTLEDLRKAGCPYDVVQAIDCVTKREDENNYDDFIRRVLESNNPMAMQVKIADIQDNMNPARLQYIPEEKRTAMVTKYTAALKRLRYSY